VVSAGVQGRAAAEDAGRGHRLQRVDARRSRGGSSWMTLARARTEVSSKPGHRAGRRRPQADRDGDRLLVVEQQRRHRRAGLQLVAAGDAAAGVDRDSRARAAGRRRGAACAG
jgi:hypothetical protein